MHKKIPPWFASSFITNRHLCIRTIALLVLTVFAIGFYVNDASKPEIAKSTDAQLANLYKNYVNLPLQFESNRGQAEDEVAFLSKGPGYSLLLTPQSSVLALKNGRQSELITTSFIGANLPMEFRGGEQLPGKVNYLLGKNKNGWVTNVPTFADVVAKEIYPGIDLRYHGDKRQLEYDFIVKPGVDPQQIRMQFEGVKQLTLDDDGRLVIHTEQGLLYHNKPIIYQDINQQRVSVNGRYLLADNNTVSFRINDYDHEHTLVIDPILDFSTYLGGDDNDKGLAIAIDATGSAYVAGTTMSSDFSVLNPYQSTLNGSQDAFIVKLTPSGDALEYATYFGGSGNEGHEDDDDYDDDIGEDDNDDNDSGDSDSDLGKDIVVDSTGHVYLTGTTDSSLDFPIINAVQPVYGGGPFDSYVAKLIPAGDDLLFSTYLGGDNKDKGFGITLDQNGDVYVAGMTRSNDFPVVNALQASKAGGKDAFVTVLNNSGSQILYSSYFGGSKADSAKGIAVDSSGNITLTGVTKSKNDFPLANALQSSFGGGGRDAFVAQISSDGSALNFSTYLGGSKKDKGRGVAVDSQGNVIVVGLTKSQNFPLANALQGTYGGGSDDGFVTKLSANGDVLVFSTYLGGSKTDRINNIAIAANDDIYVVGTTKSVSGIPVQDAVQATLNGSKRDAFITGLAADGSSILFGTYLGGSKNDRGKDIALDNNNNIYITGVTRSNTDFPVLNAIQPNPGATGSGNPEPTHPIYVHGQTYQAGDQVSSIDGVYQCKPYPYEGWCSQTAYTPGASLYWEDAWERLTAMGGVIYLGEITAYGNGNTYDPGNVVLHNNQHYRCLGWPYSGWCGQAGYEPGVGSAWQQAWEPITISTGGAGTKDAFIAKIAADNQPPVITSTPVTNGILNQAYSYTVEALDDDGDTLSFSLTLAPTGMVIDDQTGVISWLPDVTGDFTVTVSVSDGNGGTAEQSYTLTIINPNQPPAIVTTPVTEATTGLLYSYDVEATDPELDTLFYSLQVAPAGMTIDSVAGLIEWTPAAAGDFSVNVLVTDGNGGSDVQGFTITVTDDVTAPVIIISSPANGTITNQALQTVSGSLSESATLTINGQPATVNADNTFSFGPISLAEGLNSISVIATDPSANTSSVVISVTLDTIAPELVLESPAPNTLINNTDVIFSGSVNETATLTIDGQAVTVDPQLDFNTTLTLDEGSNSVDIIATDTAGNTTTQTVTVTVDITPPAIPDTNLINRSNPNSGVVMVTGQAGSVEPGSLVHVINPNNGYEALELAQSDGSFSTDVPAFANESLTVFTVDAAGNTSASAFIGPATTPTLTLNAIGNKIAPLGQITRFTVTATDSTGEAIQLGLTPLPLPDNMEYNIRTGEFSFQPTSDQAGDYELVFSAKNGDEYVSETITLTVPAADPNAPTAFTGRILDANSMEAGTAIPIVGATVSFLDAGVSTVTDSQGYFTLNNLPTTAAVFDIDGSTAQPGPNGAIYASFREGLPIVSNVTNLVERPFYMPRLDASSLTTIDPNITTTVTNPNLGISLTVAPGTAINDSDGTPFTGQMSISEVPRDLAPGNLPEIIDPALLITIQPVGVSYTTPAPITFANTEGLPPGNEVDIWSVDPDLGQFVIVGTGQVTADGQFIETIAGGIRANDWHAELSPAADPEGTEEQNPDNPCPTCPSAPGASMFSLHDGHMSKNFSLPAYRSLESSRALTFSYRSFRAYPRPSVGFNGEIIRRSEVPQTISIELEVAGLEQGQETFLSTTGFSEEQDEPFRVAASFDASDFESGMYDYRLKVTNNFASGTSRSTFIDNRIMIENEVMSPFGAGWMLEGLYRLAINEDDDSVTLLAPAGNSRTYRESGVPGEYDSPDNDYAEFVLNTDGSYTHTEKDGVRMEFDETGLITAHIDRNGNTNSYVYDADGKLETITDPVGLVTTFTYDNNGRLATVTDPAGRVSTFEFDVLGNLTQITYPDNTFETFEYDDRHLMVAHEDENQNRYTDRYDAFGRIIDGTLPDGTVIAATGKTTIGLVDVNSGIGSASNPAPIARPADANSEYVDGRGNPSSKELDRHGRTTVEVDEVGRVTTHIRDTDSNATQTTRPIGSVVTRTFDSFGNVLTQREEFNGATTSYNYDNFSLVTSVTNPRNHTTTINRDPATGNPLSIVNDLGHTTTMTYNSQGLVETMTSPNGLVTSYTYNAQGLMETKTETPPAGSPGNVRVWSYSYFPTGLLQTVNTPDGITLNYTYDARSLLTSVTDNLGQQIIYTYDAHKNVIQTETLNSDGSLALLVDSVYDERNRLIETRAPHGQTDESITQRILDANSNLVGLIDPNGNQSTNTYDAFNRLENNIHRESGVTLYEYDDQDRITKVIAPNGVTTEYQYDLISRRTREISPDRGIIQYGYDLANNVVSIIDGRGIEATMTYDELERVSTKTYPNTLAGKNENVTYTYDTCGFGIGYLCTRVDESGSYAYNYDAFGNLTDQTFTEQGGTVYTQSYVYDDGDNMTQMTLPSGRVIDYQRDGVRRVSAIDTTLNGTAQNIVNTIQYRGDNQVTQRTFGNGLIDERTYDLQGRLGSQLLRDSLNNLVDQRLYNYDKNSNVLGIDTNLEDNVYTYDMLDRLTSDNIDTDVPIEFSYDLNDNRLTKALQDTSFDELLTYYANSNRILTTDALQIGASPIPAIPNREMVYNDVGRLFQLIEEGNLKAEYIYNDEGQRTRKTVYQPDGITVGSITIYHYDRMGYLVTETTETGQLIKDYIWQEGMTPVAQIDSNGGSESIVYLHTDHLMTSRLATDQFQFVAWRWEGEAFGNTPAEELTGVSINLRFPGQYYDEEAGLHYNRFRYYDPSLGRYITSDPIGLLAGLNTYNYADANPLKYIDPLGLFSFAGIKREIENASRPIVLCNEYGCGMVGLEARESAYENCVSCEARCVAEFIIPGYEDLVAQGLKQGAKKAASDAAKAGLKFAAKRINIVFTVLDAGLAATCVLECK